MAEFMSQILVYNETTNFIRHCASARMACWMVLLSCGLWCWFLWNWSFKGVPGSARRLARPWPPPPKPLKNRFFFASFFQCLFGSIFDPFCLPTCLPRSIDMHQKSVPRCIPSWVPFFDRLLLPTWTPCTQSGTSGLAPNAFFHVFREIDFWSHFGTNLAPFCSQNPTKST